MPSKRKKSTNLKIQYKNIDLVKPYFRNPRKNSEAVEAVALSIKKFGFNVPITVDLEGVIITGHTRYRAAKQLELTEVPVIQLNLDPAKATEYRMADNMTSELAEWDEDMLVAELRMVDDLDDFSVFFPKVDIMDLIGADESTTAHKSVSGVSIHARGIELEGQYDDAGGDGSDQIEIPCPHCGESMFISRGDLEEKLERMG